MNTISNNFSSICGFCNSTESPTLKLKRCSRCHLVLYCGRSCQTSHWSEHKKSCSSSASHEQVFKKGIILFENLIKHLESGQNPDITEWDKLILLWSTATANGSRHAQCNLHYLFSNVGMDSNVLAADNFLKNIHQGYPRAQFRLGVIYEKGQGVEQSYEKAIEWYEKAATQGHADAQCNLGILYNFGQGCKLDQLKAVEWYEKAADQGQSEASVFLGGLYYGSGPLHNFKKAFEWFQQAANQEHAGAQDILGNMYANGRGVNRCYKMAAKWYSQAANQGDADAQDRLGVLYQNGQGVPKSYAEAKKWYLKSAEQDHAEAQYHLGEMFYAGLGMKITFDTINESFDWFMKANKHGHALSQERLGLALRPVWVPGTESPDVSVTALVNKEFSSFFDRVELVC